MSILFLGSVKPGQVAWNEQSQVVVETVTKTSTTQQFAGVQQFKSDASKVTSRGAGLQKATIGKEATFTVDTKDAGMSSRLPMWTSSTQEFFK